ncbi:hypothetical protein N8580_00470 [Akkermansiaceae bacterium]|nr:hypothetical protein [Akkermansiaceae bacterium]
MNFKIVQFGLNRDDPKESQSMEQLKQLSNDMNVRYIRIENPPYEWDAPVDNIFNNWRGNYVGRTKPPNAPGLNLTDFNYGCWLAHKQAISLGFADRGHTLICESDCRILDIDLFKQRLSEAVELFNSGVDYPIIRFEPPFYPAWIKTKFGKQVSKNIYECDQIFSGHCHLINENSKELFTDLYETRGWLTNDDWLNYNLGDRNIPMLAFKELLTFQFDGSSTLNVYTQNFNEMVKDIDESIKQNLSI